jgi:hypothetical protein
VKTPRATQHPEAAVQLRITIAALWFCLLASGCDDLSEFKTKPDVVFRGEVVGSDPDPTADSFIRKGFASHTWLDMRFNPEAGGVPVEDAGEQASRRAVPGMLTTYVCPDGGSDCAFDARVVDPFDHARLLPIDGLAHDTLSQYTFPGGGRLRNYIFSLRFTSQIDEVTVPRDAMIFVSLMDTEQIEVRAIAPGIPSKDGQSEALPALFGIFVLGRQHL